MDMDQNIKVSIDLRKEDVFELKRKSPHILFNNKPEYKSEEEAKEAAIFYLKYAIEKSWDSPDTSTKNGAVLVAKTHVIGVSCNTFPNKVTSILDDRDEKLCRITHAERGAIFNAIKTGYYVPGSILYCPFAACTDCANAIIECRVSELITLTKTITSPSKWIDNVKKAYKILEEAGVKLTLIDEPLGMKMWRGGKEIDV
jgi:deoxycytidylate deaminase